MKKIVLGLAALATLSLSLSAQSFTALKVHFNQAVAVGANTLPAGDYTVTEVGHAGSPMLHFHAEHGANVVVFAELETTNQTATRTDVVLSRDTNNVERVSRIDVEGTNLAYVLR